MAEPFLSELRLFSFVFPPKGWALCNGQLLPINQNQALFSLFQKERLPPPLRPSAGCRDRRSAAAAFRPKRPLDPTSRPEKR